MREDAGPALMWVAGVLTLVLGVAAVIGLVWLIVRGI